MRKCGYYTNFGYLGFVSGQWMLFANEAEYHEYLEDQYDA